MLLSDSMITIKILKSSTMPTQNIYHTVVKQQKREPCGEGGQQYRILWPNISSLAAKYRFFGFHGEEIWIQNNLELSHLRDLSFRLWIWEMNAIMRNYLIYFNWEVGDDWEK